MKVLESSGAIIDPCGTPAIILSHSLNESPVFQLSPIKTVCKKQAVSKLSNVHHNHTNFFILCNCMLEFSVIICSAYC